MGRTPIIIPPAEVYPPTGVLDTAISDTIVTTILDEDEIARTDVLTEEVTQGLAVPFITISPGDMLDTYNEIKSDVINVDDVNIEKNKKNVSDMMIDVDDVEVNVSQNNIINANDNDYVNTSSVINSKNNNGNNHNENNHNDSNQNDNNRVKNDMITDEDIDDIVINNAIIMDNPTVYMKEGDGT
jgi:hypothetical protein